MTVHQTGFSGGGGSWLTAKIVQRELVRPGDQHMLVFADVLYEDADTYRFLLQGALNVFGRSYGWVPHAEDFPDYRVPDIANLPLADYKGHRPWREFLAQLRARASEEIPELTWLVEGRDPWEIYRDERFLGNSAVDPCSKIGKRRMLDRWRTATLDPANSILYFGIGSGEAHRYDGVDRKTGNATGLKSRMAEAGWNAQAPLIGRIEGETTPVLYMLNAGLAPARNYGWAAHDNCGGMCCKAGIRHNVKRLEVAPDRFAYDAMMEAKFTEWLGANATFLRDRRRAADGSPQNRPLGLVELASRYGVHDLDALAEADDASRQDSGNGCGCAIDEPEAA